MKRRNLLSLLTAACVITTACSCTGIQQNTPAEGTNAASKIPEKTSETAETIAASMETSVTSGDLQTGSVSLSLADMFTTRDYEIGYSDCTEISLSDSGSSVTGNGASVSGNVVTITESGSYRITGTLTDGQIVVDAGDEKVQLVLDNASVTCAGSAALYIKSADKVFITTAAGSDNKLASTGEFQQSDDNKIDGAVFAKSDITFNGTGALDVSCETAHGIVGKDDIKVTGGTYTIASAKKGIDCNESVRFADGSITVTSGTDGIHAENSDDASKAFVYIGGGSINITSGSDAIDASGEILTSDGNVTITSDGGAENAPAHNNNDFGMRWDRDQATADSDSASSSAKGLKSDGLITIDGGTFIIDSSDDAVHADNVSITGGTITATTGDDGIHADNTVTISDGTVNIIESYEGIEGEIIEINGGSITVKASDDGMNAAGGSTDVSSFGGRGGMETDQNAKLTISGGRITVNADGDGLDSNGYLYITGGTTFVSGPTNSGNGALDYGISATITGGSIIAAGAAGMAENFGSESTQGAILYTFDSSVAAGTEISLLDESGSTLISYAPEKAFQCAVISTPDIAAGSTYTVKAGDSSYPVEMTSNIYGSGSGMGGFGGRGRFDENSESSGNSENFGANGENFGGKGGFGGRGGRRNFTDSVSDESSESGSAAQNQQETPSVSSGSSDADAKDSQAANEQMPQRPDDGQMPQRPDDGQMPQRPEDGQMPQRPGDGQMPQRPGDGQMPQRPGDGQMPEDSVSA